jgi:hypothetical protein
MPPAQATPAAPTILVANPTLRFDVASGLVVIEFHDEAGAITTSVPTLRQLEAYRLHSQTTPNQAPPAATSVHGSTPPSQAPTAKPTAASVHVSATSKV